MDGPTLTSVSSDLKVRSLLDLGCGSGSLLVDFCKSDSDCYAWGIDQNVEMCIEAGDAWILRGLPDAFPFFTRMRNALRMLYQRTCVVGSMLSTQAVC